MRIFLMILLTSSGYLLTDGAAQTVVTIGGLFDTAQQREVFKLAVDFVNNAGLLGPDLWLNYTVITADYIAAFQNIQFACKQAEDGVMAFIGPMTSTSTKAVGPISHALRIPQITPTATSPLLGNKKQFPYLIRIMAPDSVQSVALVDLVESFGWKQMAILTSNSEYGIHGLVEFQAIASKKEWRVTSVQHFQVGNSPSELDVTRQLETIKATGVRIILLNAIAVYSKEVFKQALALDMMESGWAWVVTDGTTAMEELSKELPIPAYLHGVLGTAPSAAGGYLRDEFMVDWNKTNAQANYTWGPFSMSSGLLVDAVLTFAYAVREMYSNDTQTVETPSSLSCETSSPNFWPHGEMLLHHLLRVQEDGLNSFLQFNSDGVPQIPRYEIVSLQRKGWIKVGDWDSRTRLSMSSGVEWSLLSGQKNVRDFISALANKTVTIATAIEEPFVMYVKDGDAITNQLEGFCVDLLETLAHRIGFTYDLYVVKDGKHGTQDPATLQWNGIVKDLADRVADMGVASMTITGVRNKYIDFTTPILDFGTTFVMKVPEKEKNNVYAFLKPLSLELWMYFIGTSVLVGVVVSLFNRISPYDYHGHFVYVDDLQEKDHMVNYKEWKKFQKRRYQALSHMSVSNATWFTTGLLVKQGGEIYPRSLSARITSMTWWLATVIVSATYTANLAAFLSASRTHSTITGVEGLAAQDEVLYGTLIGSASEEFFVSSEIQRYREMLDFMRRRNTSVGNTAEGIDKAREGGFAFISDSVILNHQVEQRPCNSIHTIGRVFGKMSYGIGLQKNSPYNDELSWHILQLRQSGYIEELEEKWVKKRGECFGQSAESAHSADDTGGQLGTSHMLGVFYIIYGGLVLGVAVLGCEWVVATIRSVDPTDVFRSNTSKEALRKRWKLCLQDVVEDWLHPLCRRRTHVQHQSLADSRHD